MSDDKQEKSKYGVTPEIVDLIKQANDAIRRENEDLRKILQPPPQEKKNG